MNKFDFIVQLEKRYRDFLKNRIAENQFEQIVLRGGKAKPSNSIDLHESVGLFLKYEKNDTRKGWYIEWENWFSKKLGQQRWPAQIKVQTEEDFLFLIKKENEILLFDQKLEELRKWRPEISSWLIEQPEAILRYLDRWQGLKSVIDFLLLHDVSTFYMRNLPVPVHTKFIEENESLILALIRHFDPERFRSEDTKLSRVIGIKRKPVLFTVRWLDESLAARYSHGMEVFGITPENLKKQHWQVKEVWLVENETALYMFDKREHSVVIWSRGKALELLEDIPLFNDVALYYWGDLDEEGFSMLSQCRKLYPRVRGVLMDADTVEYHLEEIRIQPVAYKHRQFSELAEAEAKALEILFTINGRLEQESLNHKFILKVISTLIGN
ncbi:Wadjet anti-phage system protein JetD domain-containing protein [Ferruginibacter sp.]